MLVWAAGKLLNNCGTLRKHFTKPGKRPDGGQCSVVPFVLLLQFCGVDWIVGLLRGVVAHEAVLVRQAVHVKMGSDLHRDVGVTF